MSSAFRRSMFRAKAILCLLLVLNVQFFIAGCGTNGELLPADQLRISIAPDDPLIVALKDSPFAGASAVDLSLSQQEFSLVLPGRSQKLSGKYAFVDGQFTITQFSIENRNQSATLDLDTAKHVTQIVTGDGLVWKAPDSSRDVTESQGSGVDAYLAANTALMDLATQLDAERAASGNTTGSTTTDTPDPTKTGATAQGFAAVLWVFATIMYPIIAIVPGLITLFTVGSVLQGTLVTRFDGTWDANNAGSTLQVTIKGGKIAKLIDPSSGQEFDVTNSELQSVQGNHVVWSADGAVLGQSTPVTFEFDVTEMSNGSLQGTLTTEGNTFAKVPVTMIRAS